MSQDSDEHLIRYLLGDLPYDEAEALDERSITDDAIALRLAQLETGLVDRYARGERFADFERFRALHLASPYLQDRVRFAQALQSVAMTPPARETPPVRRSPGGLIAGLAAAAVLVLAWTTYLFLANQRLHRELELQRSAPSSVDQQKEPAPRAGSVTVPAPLTATFLLPPPRRGASEEGTAITVSRNIGQVALRLRVESDEYVRFWAAVKDPAGSRMVWRSGDVTPEADGADRIVTITVAAAVLRDGRYTIELTGISSGGAAELVGEYPIRVVLE